MIWLCGGALALNLLLVGSLLVLLAVNGLSHFWPRDLVSFELADGSRLLGEIHERKPVAGSAADEAEPAMRIRVKAGNRERTRDEFLWIEESAIARRETPSDAVLLERVQNGNFHGYLEELHAAGAPPAVGRAEAWRALAPVLAEKHREAERVERFLRDEIDPRNRRMEALRFAARRLEIDGVPEAKPRPEKDSIESERRALGSEIDTLGAEVGAMRDELLEDRVVLSVADGSRFELPVASIVRALRPNELGTAGSLRLWLARLWEFVSGDPRESNTEGGVFPALFGTVLMVFLMSIAVVPLGVLAALYLREYAKQGAMVQAVRIAVNNLAGVPSIVFGVFGLGFFVYVLGGSLDALFFPERLPRATLGTGGILWASLTLALLTVPVVIVATEEGLAAVPRIVREGSLALGATKFETTWRVVLPAAAPGILTGLILAMARAAGEVAPLMIVGMVKMVSDLPVDGEFPYVHFERKFMHLGFQIYDVGFQSPNVEAVKPLVFATAFLLVFLVVAMNALAIRIRSHLQRKYAGAAV